MQKIITKPNRCDSVCKYVNAVVEGLVGDDFVPGTSYFFGMLTRINIDSIKKRQRLR